MESAFSLVYNELNIANPNKIYHFWDIVEKIIDIKDISVVYYDRININKTLMENIWQESTT